MEMGLRSWWRARQEASARVRENLAMNSNQEAIAHFVPELLGVDEVKGMAHVLDQIGEWNKTCTPDQAATFAGRLIASQESWEKDGMVMPYWGTLAVLRSYQDELAGRDGVLSRGA